jgi:hypothetical protein
MADPKNAPKPQPTEGVGFNPAYLAAVIADLNEIAPGVQKLVVDIGKLIANPPMFAGKSLAACCPDEHCRKCCETLKSALLTAAVAYDMVQSCDEPCPVPPTPNA